MLHKSSRHADLAAVSTPHSPRETEQREGWADPTAIRWRCPSRRPWCAISSEDRSPEEPPGEGLVLAVLSVDRHGDLVTVDRQLPTRAGTAQSPEPMALPY